MKTIEQNTGSQGHTVALLTYTAHIKFGYIC